MLLSLLVVRSNEQGTRNKKHKIREPKNKKQETETNHKQQESTNKQKQEAQTEQKKTIHKIKKEETRKNALSLFFASYTVHTSCKIYKKTHF